MKVEYDIVYFFVYCLSVLSNAKNVLVIVGKTAIEKKILPWSFVITYSPEHRGLLRFVFPLYCRVLGMHLFQIVHLSLLCSVYLHASLLDCTFFVTVSSISTCISSRLYIFRYCVQYIYMHLFQIVHLSLLCPVYLHTSLLDCTFVVIVSSISTCISYRLYIKYKKFLNLAFGQVSEKN